MTDIVKGTELMVKEDLNTSELGRAVRANRVLFAVLGFPAVILLSWFISMVGYGPLRLMIGFTSIVFLAVSIGALIWTFELKCPNKGADG